jgi:response regulator RpfG family c-di-GMP phosphodiesterase
MTGHSEEISMQTAYDMGVDEFINKPFDMQDMNLVVGLILKDFSKTTYGDGEKFYKVPLTEFILASVNDYDVFLKVNKGFLCLARRGQELLPERLENYHKKGMNHIYLTSKDFARYIGMQINISDAVRNKPFSKVKKIKLFNHFCQSLTECAFNEFMSESLYEKVFESFESYTQITFDNTEIFDLMMNSNQKDAAASSKSVVVAFLALAVFQQWKWNHPKYLSNIVMGALLCDVAIENTVLSTKKAHEMTSEELKIYEKHPLQSYTALSKIRNIPEEVLYVVLQHHENDIGLGFPQKLTKQKIHPYSRVIHTLHEFVDQADGATNKDKIKDCLEMMYSYQKNLVCVQVLKTLYIIFDIPVPWELSSVLLPTDLNWAT